MNKPLTENLTIHVGEFYKQAQGRQPSLILMARDTFHELQREGCPLTLTPPKISGHAPKFGGIPIQFCDQMAFGAVATPLPG